MTWTASEETKIEGLMKERKITRFAAIRKMRADEKVNHVKVQKVAAKVAAKKGTKKDGPTTQHEPTERIQEMIDDAMRSAVKKEFGEVVAVEGLLAHRNSNGPQGAPYQRYLLANGRALFVGSWVGAKSAEDIHVGISTKKAADESPSVSRFLATKARKAARELKAEKAHAKADVKRAAKASKAVVKADLKQVDRVLMSMQKGMKESAAKKQQPMTA